MSTKSERSPHLLARLLAIFALAVTLSITSFAPSFAEGEESGDSGSGEVESDSGGSDESAPEPAPEPEVESDSGGSDESAPEPAPEPEYTPPPEAFEGLGGWAVVDPATGNVHGVIVGNFNEEVWEGVNERQSRDSSNYMGCPSPCVLRFQTRATPDGNVAGWHGTSYNSDGTYSNDGSVRWDAASGTFTMRNSSSGGGTTSQSIVPSKTSRDSNGEGRTYNIGSGIVDIETTTTKTSGDQSARVSVKTDNLSDTTATVDINYPAWGPDGRKLRYIIDLDALPTREAYEAREEPSALDGISLDVDSVLMEEGYTATETTVDDETGEETETVVLDTSNEFVAAIRSVTDAVVTFLGSLFGLNNAP